MSSRWFSVVAVAGVLLLWFGAESQAQNSSSELIQIHRWINERRDLIASWELQRRVQISLAVLTSVLGIFIAVLQTAERKRMRVLTVAFSATVVALTAMTNRSSMPTIAHCAAPA